MHGERELRVFTAAHMVYDDSEAKRTTLALFHHDDDGDPSAVVWAQGVRLWDVHVNTDSCTFIAQLEDNTDLSRVTQALSEEIIASQGRRHVGYITPTWGSSSCEFWPSDGSQV